MQGHYVNPAEAVPVCRKAPDGGYYLLRSLDVADGQEKQPCCFGQQNIHSSFGKAARISQQSAT